MKGCVLSHLRHKPALGTVQLHEIYWDCSQLRCHGITGLIFRIALSLFFSSSIRNAASKSPIALKWICGSVVFPSSTLLLSSRTLIHTPRPTFESSALLSVVLWLWSNDSHLLIPCVAFFYKIFTWCALTLSTSIKAMFRWGVFNGIDSLLHPHFPS